MNEKKGITPKGRLKQIRGKGFTVRLGIIVEPNDKLTKAQRDIITAEREGLIKELAKEVTGPRA